MSEQHYVSARHVALEHLNAIALRRTNDLEHATGQDRRDILMEIAKLTRTMLWLLAIKGDTPEVTTEDLQGLRTRDLKTAVEEEVDKLREIVAVKYAVYMQYNP